MKKFNPIIFLYFTILSIYYGFKETPFELPNIIDGALILISCMLFLIYVFNQKFKARVLLNIMLLGGLTVITLYTTRNPAFLLSVMSAIIICRSDYRDILKLVFVERLSINFFINICSILGIIQNVKVTAKSGVLVQCYSLGYNHANKFACVVGMLILLYLCIKEKELRLRNIIGIIIIVAFTSLLTQTRTFILIMGLLIILLLGMSANEIIVGITKKGIRIIAKWIIPVCYGIGIGIPYLMASRSELISSWSNFINYITSERFLHASRVISLYPIRLFGGVTNFQLLIEKYNYNVVDNGYIRLLYGYGVVGAIIFGAFYICTIKKLIEQEKEIYLIAIIVLSIWGISENVLYSFCYNFTILFWGELLGKDFKKRRKKVKFKI